MSIDRGRKAIQTYALVVCFTSLLIGAVFLGVAALDLVQISFPGFTNPYAEVENQPRTTVIDSSVSMIGPQFRHTNAQHVMFAKRSLLSCSIAISLSALFFIIHWRLAKRYEEDSV